MRVCALLLALSCVAFAGDTPIPLVKPTPIIELKPLPDGTKLKLTRDEALKLAAKCAGFPKDDSVSAKSAMFLDCEAPRLDRKKPGSPVPAWVVDFPKATVRVRLSEDHAEDVPCPIHVALDGQTGKFLCAWGDSAPQWAKGSSSAKWADEYGAGEPQAPPKLTVRDVLRIHHYRPQPTGQFFVRYWRITTRYPARAILQPDGTEELVPEHDPFDGWTLSRRGVIDKGGWSVPPGYHGPPLYGTCSDQVLDDKTAKDVSGKRY